MFEHAIVGATGTRARVRSLYRACEVDCVRSLVARAASDPETLERTQSLARELVLALRRERRHGIGVDALMHEFSLSSDEGVALMCLAEALLRTPDAANVDRLIRDKIAPHDWSAHLGSTSSVFANAAAWGLLVTGKLVATTSEAGLTAALARIVGRGGEPLVRNAVRLAMRLLGERFVLGETIESALSRAKREEARGYRYSYDMLGEAAMTERDARRYADAYEHAIHAIGADARGASVYERAGISIKLSALHPRYGYAQAGRMRDELVPRVVALARLARRYQIGINIDAEEADRLEPSLDVIDAICEDESLAGWDGIGFVVQAYQKRAPAVIEHLLELARRSARRLMVRLVKGAYWDAEIKRAQIDGMQEFPVYTRKVHTDVSYLACADLLLAHRDRLFAQFATHNAYTVAAIVQRAGPRFAPGDYEFQCLHGMGEPLYDHVRATLARPCRIYAPVGTHKTLLAYLVRRLLENGANTSFVHRVVDSSVSVDSLVRDPVTLAAELGGAPHPQITLPRDLFLPQRRNSRGIDLSDVDVRERLARAIGESRRAGPLAPALRQRGQPPIAIVNPADRRDVVGWIIEATSDDVDAALARAESARSSWSDTPLDARAASLERAADAMERDTDALVALVVREAGRTLPNAIAEVREAVDFLRFYAADARAALCPRSAPLRVVTCISPWNFPLAIFTGQVAAALVAGNAVIAKPAEKTPLVAARAVAILHAAGVHEDALLLVPGRGELVGARLVADARTAGVLFTGSTAVARSIARAIALRPDVVLIAETGGQNAMIVDSTALPEQVVADVLLSAFDSAGQRCSALRVLCVQEEIADRVLDMLAGAMRELVLGDPADVETDVGPVIDAGAQHALETHIDRMRGRGHRVLQLARRADTQHGTFVPPTLVEIASIAELDREVFGPVLHVMRFRRDALDALVDAINATGYGLTLGIHSRIDDTIEAVIARAKAGNLYVNRNMIGAVVGVQPFGGEGLSGTGPKAGGPLYLHALVRGSSATLPPAECANADLPALRALEDWLRGSNRDNELARAVRDDVDAEIAALAERSPLGRVMPLRGPVGEENRLAFAPRGRMLATARTPRGAILQLAAALATGNSVVAPASAAWMPLRAALPASIASAIELVDDAEREISAGVLIDRAESDADPRALAALRVRVAAGDGPIVPVLSGPPYALERMVVERTISINTAAAGGNASLMAIGDTE